MIKIKFVFIGFLISYVAILLSLAKIQFFTSDQDADTADYLSKQIIPASRGVIYDKNGELLAGSSISYDVQVDPLFFTPDKGTLDKVAAVLDVSVASISARLQSGSARWAMLSKDVSAQKLQALRLLPVKGVSWDQKLKRDYPEASLAASVLGFVGQRDDGTQIGYYGLEGYYEDELRGLSGIYIGERDIAKRPLLFGLQDKLDSQDGRDIYLSIDKSVQQIIKRKAVEGMSRYQAKEVCIIVAEPNTMAILGLSCLPDYDPRSYADFPPHSYNTSAVSDTYEPGSTFKPLIVSQALESGAITPTEVLPEPDSIDVSDYTITNWDGKSRGKIAIPDVLAKSSNIGMVEVGAKMGNESMYTSILKYGFGTETGIDLQGEVSGSIKPKQYWYPIDYATATFGQGFAVTPMQLITAFSSVINGGELLRPYVVERVSDSINVNNQHTKTVVRRVMSESTSQIMRRILEYTIDNAEYRWQKPVGYRFGGKTGTAQIAVNGKYDTSKTIASFIGFTPVDKPRFIALIVIKEPSTSSWGSETAAPLFFEMAKELITYFGIPPEY
ncbi:MAG: penicillin-binding transpeptidase domain-containing protein [Candidatus Roizmanbacteria bacterium]